MTVRCCRINLNSPFSHCEKSPRDDFWRAFEDAANRRRAIAARLRYLNGAEADPASLTPGQVENIPGKIAKLLADLGGVPAYRSKLAAIWPRLSLFASAAEDWLADYDAERWRDRDFAGMTSAERRFAMSAFGEFRRPE